MWCLFNLFLRVLLGALQHRKPSQHERRSANFETAHKKQALTDVEVRKRLKDLPRAHVLSVIDGDSLNVSIARDRIEVRLDSIDCPEGKQAWGEQAAVGLRKILNRRMVLIEIHGQDQYGRKLATLYAVHLTNHECVNVNELMVMAGHAWVNRLHYDHLPPDRQEKFNELQRFAKTKGLGLWGEPNPLPPWEWRKANRC
jgi:micrococcal nuclease